MNKPPFRCADCVIGEFNDYGNTRVVTYKDLKEEVRPMNKFYYVKKIKFSDFFDLRKLSGLNHFRFCPVCGQRIEWKKLLAQAKQDEKIERE